MCGIFGFQVRKGFELDPAESAILGLTLADKMESRGRDSFGGVFWKEPDGKGAIATVKGLGRITEDGPKFLKCFSDTRKMLGHTRAATVGAVNLPNTHPFEIGDVIGVHNGAVYNHEAMKSKYGRDKLEVDSQHIFAHINEGIDTAELDVYGAIVFTRKSEEFAKLYLTKSLNGSLYVARLYKHKPAKQTDPHAVIAWASTQEALTLAAKRLGFDYWTVTLSSEKLYTIEGGDIYDIDRKVNFGTKPYNTGNNGNAPFQSRYGDNRRRLVTNLPDYHQQNSTRESKRERKARVKRERTLNTFWDELTADPDPKNLKSEALALRQYHGAIARMLCHECLCDLDEHSWGFCKNNHLNTCRQTSGQLCSSTGLKSCRDCGCYLIETIHHAEAQIPEVLYCMECQTYCCAEDLLIGGDPRAAADDDEVDEITEQDGDANPTDSATTVIDVNPLDNILPMVAVDATGPNNVVDIQQRLNSMRIDLETTTGFRKLDC